MVRFLLHLNFESTGISTQVWQRIVYLTTYLTQGSVTCSGLSNLWHFAPPILLMATHVCAHSPTVVTHPDRPEPVAECTLYVLQVRTWTTVVSGYQVHALICLNGKEIFVKERLLALPICIASFQGLPAQPPWKVSFKSTISEKKYGNQGLEKYQKCRQSRRQNKPRSSSLHAAS